MDFTFSGSHYLALNLYTKERILQKKNGGIFNFLEENNNDNINVNADKKKNILCY